MNVSDLTVSQVAAIKRNYPPGTRIELIRMVDPAAVHSGVRGSVVAVDDKGQIHMMWDDGRTLALILQLDEFKIVTGNQPLFDFFKAHPGYSFDLFTPCGYIFLTPDRVTHLLNDGSVAGHPGDPDLAMTIPAQQLVVQYVFGIPCAPQNKVFHIMTCLEPEE